MDYTFPFPNSLREEYVQIIKDEVNIKEIEEKIRKEGEWIIYPFVVHHLIAKGRAGIDLEDNIYIDGIKMPKEGYQFKSNNLPTD